MSADTQPTMALQFIEWMDALLQPPTTPEGEQEVLQHLRQINENFKELLYSFPPQITQFTSHCLPIMLNYLYSAPINFLANHFAHMSRKAVMLILLQLPFTELEPHQDSLLLTMYFLLENDNEQIGDFALRLINEAHRRPSIPTPKQTTEALKFFTICHNMVNHFLANFAAILRPAPAFTIVAEGTIAVDHLVPKIFSETEFVYGEMSVSLLPKSALSLRVLAEASLTLARLYGRYKAIVDSRMLAAMIMRIVELKVDSEMIMRAKENGRWNESHWVVVVTIQIKFFALLTRIIYDADRANQLLDIFPHVKVLPQIIVQLLTSCPPKKHQLRIELYGSISELLHTSALAFFPSIIEQLLNPAILFGSELAAVDITRTRPIGYKVFYHLAYKIRTSLTSKQLFMLLERCMLNLHDATMRMPDQELAAKTMAPLADAFCKRVEVEEKTSKGATQEVRKLLLGWLVLTLTEKMEFIVKYKIPFLAVEAEVMTQPAAFKWLLFETPRFIQTCIGALKILLELWANYAAPVEMPDFEEVLKELEKRYKDVSAVLKVKGRCNACIEVMKEVNANIDLQCDSVKATETALYVLKRLLVAGMAAFRIFKINDEKGLPLITITTDKINGLIEQFGSIFMLLPPQTLRRLFFTSMSAIVQAVYYNDTLLYLVSTFLVSRPTSYLFQTSLLNYLTPRMDRLDVMADRATIYLKLFRYVFGILEMGYPENEVAVEEKCAVIIRQAMKMVVNDKNPINYLLVLRALFRATNARHVKIITAIQSMLPELITWLARQNTDGHRTKVKLVLIELCLTLIVSMDALQSNIEQLIQPIFSHLCTYFSNS